MITNVTACILSGLVGKPIGGRVPLIGHVHAPGEGTTPTVG